MSTSSQSTTAGVLARHKRLLNELAGKWVQSHYNSRATLPFDSSGRTKANNEEKRPVSLNNHRQVHLMNINWAQKGMKAKERRLYGAVPYSLQKAKWQQNTIDDHKSVAYDVNPPHPPLQHRHHLAKTNIFLHFLFDSNRQTGGVLVELR